MIRSWIVCLVGIKMNAGKWMGENGFDRKNGRDETRFQFVESLTDGIVKVLERRLPMSANVFNMTKVYDNFKKPDEMAFYVLNTNTQGNEELLEDHCWILASYFREDYGMRYAISAPLIPEITPEIRTAFINCPYIDWNDSYHFSCISFDISQLIWEISTKVFGNSTTSMPCKIYALDKDEAARLSLDASVEHDNSNLLLKRMDTIKGAEFISSTWKYSCGEKTILALRKLLKRNKSVGLYDQSGIGNRDESEDKEKEGKIICGMLINDCGLLGMLYTLPEYRGKGLATIVAQKLIKSFAEEDGAVPCSAVEIKNYKSIAFHEKLGMKFSHYADFIKYVPQSWN